MYKRAVFGNMRWSTRRGVCSVEDLVFLPVEELDGLYKDLMKAKRAQSEDSLLEKMTSESKVLDLKIAIVKDIVETRLAEAEARKAAVSNAAQRARLLEIKKIRQDDGLKELSDEDLDAQIDALG